MVQCYMQISGWHPSIMQQYNACWAADYVYILLCICRHLHQLIAALLQHGAVTGTMIGRPLPPWRCHAVFRCTARHCEFATLLCVTLGASGTQKMTLRSVQQGCAAIHQPGLGTRLEGCQPALQFVSFENALGPSLHCRLVRGSGEGEGGPCVAASALTIKWGILSTSSPGTAAVTTASACHKYGISIHSCRLLCPTDRQSVRAAPPAEEYWAPYTPVGREPVGCPFGRSVLSAGVCPP
jgi:hypothetical protein